MYATCIFNNLRRKYFRKTNNRLRAIMERTQANYVIDPDVSALIEG